ncbi:MAG TPA: tetratricopeptide repeat protein [Candidatus Nanoarchaeia archaeon]|nr:tetratricopeptide repeat protein [Candidatus Nanoarchaeia archaeon]
MPDEKSFFQQGTEHFKNKEFEKAVKAFQQAIQIQSTEQNLCGLGLVYTFQNKFEEAQKVFQQALQLNPESLTAKKALTKTQHQLEEFQQIAQFYQELKKKLVVDPSKALTSLIVITHNQLYYTRLCLESIFATTDVPYELILVDNASTDGTGAYFLSLEKNKHQLSPALKGLYLCLNSDNRGFAAAVNQGLKQGKGKVLGVLNNDLLFTPKWLSSLLDSMQKNKCQLIGPVCNAVEDVIQLPQLVNTSYTDVKSMLQYIGGREAAQLEYAPADWIAGFCLLIQREVVNKIGYFDEQFGLGFCEDEEYCYRARQAGFSVGFTQVFIHHYWHKSFSQLDANKQNQRVFQNLNYLLRKMIQLNPQDINAHYRLADNLVLQQNYAEAEKHYQKCLDLQPHHTEALYNLGVLYHKTKRPEQAKKSFQQLLQQNPGHEGAQKAIALVK